MKHNGPITNNQIELTPGTILVSKTDTKGLITYCNQEFIEISGFQESELIGKSHNIVRHPDMPPEAFADLWETVKTGKPWSGLVKNRAKSGDFYWVCANVTPIFKGGTIEGYMSVRTAPTAEQISYAESLYSDLRQGRVSLKPTGLAKISAIWNSISTKRLLQGSVLGVVLLQALVAWMVFAKAGNLWVYSVLGSSALISLLFGSLIISRSMQPLKYAIEKLNSITQGNYFDWIRTNRNDEFGDLLHALRAMQTQLGFEVIDTKEKAHKSTRIQTALDSVNTNVMIADANHNIIYINNSLKQMFGDIESDIRAVLPQFDARSLIGTNIDTFHKNPAHQRGMLAQLQGRHTANLEINGLHLRFIATPVLDENGDRTGTVVEWIDRTEQVQIENDIQHVVERAKAGDLNHRLNVSTDDAFIAGLSESINEMLQLNSTVIHETIDVLGSLAEGDLTRKIHGDYDGDFRELKLSINMTIEKLTSTLKRIKDTSHIVETGANDIAEGNKNLTQRNNKQVSLIEQSASAMEQINGTIQSSAGNSLEASKLASVAQEKAEIGGSVIEDTISAMDDIEKASKSIASISVVIDEIAFQTNLLALNAAVEAAHAGEHGKGFAVVASEVRNLAQRSAEAAKEVQDLVRESLDKVHSGTKLASKSGDTLKEIIGESSKVTTIIKEISIAGQEQAIGVQQINTAITTLDQGTQEKSALVQQTASASDRLLHEANQLAELVDNFRLSA